MRTVKTVVCAAILFVIAGCAGGDSVRKAHKVYPESRFLTARGIGQSESEARNKAVSELSRIFESKVGSETLDRVNLVAKSTGEETTVQKFDSRIRVLSEVELKGVEVPGTWKENGTWHALAVLERSKARENWLREISGLDSEILGGLDALGGLKGSLLRYRSLRGAIDLWLKRQVLESRITVLGFRTLAQGAYDIRSVFREAAKLKAHMQVFLDIRGEGAGLLTEKVAEALGKAGFVVAGDRSEAAVIIEGDVRAEPVDIEHPDWVYARSTVALSVVDAEAGVSVGEVSENRRSTHLNYSEAAQRALRSVLPSTVEKLLKYLEQGDTDTD
jgi:hypothetical protein